MAKNFKVFWRILLVMLLVVIIIFLYKNLVASAQNRYLAVYLDTGELYFGQKVGLRGFDLKNVWLLNKDQEGKFSLQEFQQAVWKPQEPLHLSRDKVVFWTTLDNSSQIAQLLEGKIKSSDITPSQIPTANSSGESKTRQK